MIPSNPDSPDERLPEALSEERVSPEGRSLTEGRSLGFNPRRGLRLWFRVMIPGLLAVLLMLTLALHFEVRLNLTGSLPLGLYRSLGPVSDTHALTHDEIVTACMPRSYAPLALERGYVEPLPEAWIADWMNTTMAKHGSVAPTSGRAASNGLLSRLARVRHAWRDAASWMAPCPVAHRPLGKKILALPGDQVRLDREGFEVNGHRIEATRPEDYDARGRPMHHMAESGPLLIDVPDGQVWIYSDYKTNSLDSRYFGAVAIGYILERIEPVLTF